ncbi:hypothetical protein CLU79DRAFT_886204, partial [Phycomyces nitens]
MYFHPFLNNRIIDSHTTKPHRNHTSTLSKVKAAQTWKRIGPFRHQVDFKHSHRPDIPLKTQTVPRYIHDKAAFKLKARGLKNIITNFTPGSPIITPKQSTRYLDTPQLSSNNSSTSVVTCSEATISVETRDVFVQTLPNDDAQSTVSIQTDLASLLESMSIHEPGEESSFESSSALYTDTSTPSQSTISLPKRSLPTLRKAQTAWTKSSQYQNYLKPKKSIKRMGKMAWKVVSKTTRQLFERSFEPSRRLSFSPGSTYDDIEEYEADDYNSEQEKHVDIISMELQSDVTTPSSIEFVLIAHPRSSATRLISCGVSKAKKLLYRRIRLLREDSKDSIDEGASETRWIGYMRINLNENMDREVSGRHLYSLSSPFEAAQVWQPELAVTYRFQPGKSTFGSNQSNGLDTESEEYLDIADALHHCHRGDYLTLYQRGPGCPLWIRYWAKLYRNNILLYRFSSEHKDPARLVSLRDLCLVSKPLEDEDQIFLGRHLGLVLEFKHNHVNGCPDTELNEIKRLEKQAYILLDSSANVDYWY